MCHKEGIENVRQQKLNADNIEFLYKSLNQEYGLNKVNISGGEPLLREDIVEIVRRLKQCNAKVNLTTNGYLLDKYLNLGGLLNKINVSLHTTNEDTFNEITNTKNYYSKVINNLKELRMEYPTLNISISMTLMKDFNSDYSEIERMINFASTIKASLKIIELYPKTLPNYVSLKKVEDFLIERKFVVKKRQFRKTVLSSDEVEVTLEKCTCTAVSEENEKEATCKKANDIYITSDAKISLCRLNNFEIDIYDEINNKRRRELIKKVEDGINLMGNNCKC
jgi:cyclic pyranopterin phosphate synthase